MALAVAAPTLVGVLAAVSGWHATGDNALIGLRVEDLLRGQLLTSGLPTTGENFGSGITSNHPGPLPLYLLAPFQAVFGVDAGLALGAAAINSVAWGVGVWVMARRHGPVVGALTLAVFGALAFGLSAHVLYDPISSNIAAFASVTMVLLAAAVIGGDWELLPVFTLLGSFVVQAHLTYVALGVPLVAAVVIMMVAAHVQGRSVPPAAMAKAAVVGLVLWAPVLWDQFFGAGNISSIARTFSNGNTTGKGSGFALGRLTHAIAPVPMFARPSGELGNLAFLDGAGLLRTVLGVGVLVAFGWALFHHQRTRSPYRPLGHLVVLVLVASVYSATKLPPLSTVKAANLRWMWTGGALLWLVLLVTLAQLATRRWRAPDVFSAVAVLAVAGVVAGVSSYWSVDLRDEGSFRAVDRLRSQVRDHLDKGTYIVVYQGEDTLLAVGPPVVADLVSRGYDAHVSIGRFGRAYGDHGIAKDLPRDTPALFIVTADQGSAALADQEASHSNEELIAEATWDRGDGRPPVVAQVYLADLTRSCRALSAVAAELAEPKPARTRADILGSTAILARTRLDAYEPLLRRDDVVDVRNLANRAQAWKERLDADPRLTLEQVADPDTVSRGFRALERPCP